MSTWQQQNLKKYYNPYSSLSTLLQAQISAYILL